MEVHLHYLRAFFWTNTSSDVRPLFFSEFANVGKVSLKEFRTLRSIRFSPSLTMTAFLLLNERPDWVKSASSSYICRHDKHKRDGLFHRNIDIAAYLEGRWVLCQSAIEQQ